MKSTSLVRVGILFYITQQVASFVVNSKSGGGSISAQTQWHQHSSLSLKSKVNEQLVVRHMSSNEDPSEFSREIRLREEAESPFRNVRFFFYITTIGGAATSLAVSVARIAAALSGVNTDLMEQSVTNAAVDTLGILVLAFLWKRDTDAQQSRLKRAAKGAELAKLMVRGSASLLGSDSGKSAVIPLSAFRRGRGIDKRVVIVAAGKDKIKSLLEESKQYSDSLILNDLVIVPVVVPQANAPLGLEPEILDQEYIALPAGGSWITVIGDEASQAEEQGIDVVNEGVSIVLKKNGRVGQRTRGIFLERMVSEVVERKEKGMDVVNI